MEENDPEGIAGLAERMKGSVVELEVLVRNWNSFWYIIWNLGPEQMRFYCGARGATGALALQTERRTGP